MKPFLTIENITKEYTGHRALDNVSLSIPENSIYGLLGPNGAGKTTLIRIINQIISPSSGNILFRGEPLHPRHVAQIGYLPEERGLYKKMKVGEQAIYLARLKDIKAKEARAILIPWFEKFDLMPWWNKKVETLSKGMQQKIQFIITIVHKPKLLIFDEPFSGFDPINANLLKEEIMRIRQEGSTVIFSTHNMGSVEELCDHIALINKAEKVLDGPVGEIRKAYANHVFDVELKSSNGDLARSLDSSFHILQQSKDNESIRARIQLPSQTDSNKLLKQLMDFGGVVSFRQRIPGMNDIFIKQVTGEFPQESNLINF